MNKKERLAKKNNRREIRKELKHYKKFVVFETTDDTNRPNEYWVVGSDTNMESANRIAEAYVSAEASKYGDASVFKQKHPNYSCLSIERQLDAAHNWQFMVLTTVEVMSKSMFASHLKWLYDHGYRD